TREMFPGTVELADELELESAEHADAHPTSRDSKSSTRPVHLSTAVKPSTPRSRAPDEAKPVQSTKRCADRAARVMTGPTSAQCALSRWPPPRHTGIYAAPFDTASSI